jgi:hypothetical protein
MSLYRKSQLNLVLVEHSEFAAAVLRDLMIRDRIEETADARPGGERPRTGFMSTIRVRESDREAVQAHVAQCLRKLGGRFR